MLTILDHPHTVYPNAAAAHAVADALNADDADDADAFKYVVTVDPAGTGKAIIKVYDAEGFFLGNL